MAKRITLIEDSRETQLRLLQSLSLEEEVELQPISTSPFFDERIEAAIKSFNPNLIILDLRLTQDNNSGFRVLRKLKASESLKEIPVVVCSRFLNSSPENENRKKAISYGAVAALPKLPFPKAEEFLRYAK